MITKALRAVFKAAIETRWLVFPVLYLLAASAAICEPLYAEYSLTLTAENLGLHEDFFFEENRAGIGFDYGPIAILADFSLMGGGRYGAHTAYQRGHYFLINNASIDFHLDKARFYAGFFPHHDVVETPYSVYISSVDIPVLNAGFSYVHDRFFYEARWVRLNERSSVSYIGKGEAYRDRGLTFKAVGLNLGKLTVGFEDSYLYLDQSFDAESLLSPVPMFLFEMIFDSEGRPWSQVNNVNSIMGFFAEWKSNSYYLEGQILIDDINASALAPILGWAIPALNTINNLSKVAWSLGGTLELRTGTLGFYHGGATKYTYEATYATPSDYSSFPYEYAYYPATEYEPSPGILTEIPYEENYIGYKYGENNLAFLVDYSTEVLPSSPWAFDLSASAEWVLNGSKSPANPWHEYYHWSEIAPAVELLTDPVTEHLFNLRAKLSKTLSPFDLSLAILLGYGWNQLELVELVPGEPKVFVPQSGNNGIRFSIALTGRYALEF